MIFPETHQTIQLMPLPQNYNNKVKLMKKIHTRTKRKFGLTTSENQKDFFKPKPKVHGPRTFSTEQAAHSWASENGLKKDQYVLEPAKKNKRFKIVRKN